MRSPRQRRPPRFRCRACFSPRIWRPESLASVGARRTPPTPTPQEREALAAAAKTAKVPVQGLFLTAELATRIARVGGRMKDASDADVAVVEAQESYDLGAPTWPKIDASGTLLETLGRAKAALSADPRPG